MSDVEKLVEAVATELKQQVGEKFSGEGIDAVYKIAVENVFRSIEEAGWRVVPSKATREMAIRAAEVDLSFSNGASFGELYEAMLAGSPKVVRDGTITLVGS